MNAGVTLESLYGSTETGSLTGFLDFDDSQGPDAPWKTSWDFEWLTFPPPVKPRFVDQGDGTYELQVLVRIFNKVAKDLCR